MKDKKPFRLVRKWVEDMPGPDGDPIGYLRCEYEASFWEGPTAPGETGRYVSKVIADVWMGQRFLNTSPSVSYYGELMKACKVRPSQ